MNRKKIVKFVIMMNASAAKYWKQKLFLESEHASVNNL